MLLSEHVHCVAITFKITERAEQQICIKFCVQLEQPSMDTIQMIQKAFRDDTMSAAQISVAQMIQRWSKYVRSDPCSGRPLKPADHLMVLNMYGLQSTKIGD